MNCKDLLEIINGTNARLADTLERINELETQQRRAVVLMCDMACHLAAYFEQLSDDFDERSKYCTRQSCAARAGENAFDGYRAAIGRLIVEIDHEETN